jgi:hypothetical protein
LSKKTETAGETLERVDLVCGERFQNGGFGRTCTKSVRVVFELEGVETTLAFTFEMMEILRQSAIDLDQGTPEWMSKVRLILESSAPTVGEVDLVS